MITHHCIKFHFLFARIFVVSTMLHAASCTNSNKNNKLLSRSGRPHENNRYKACKDSTPPTSKAAIQPTLQYTESCTNAAKNNKKYRAGNATTTHKNNAYKDLTGKPTRKVAIQSIPLLENRENQTGNSCILDESSLSLQNMTLSKEMLDQVEQAFSAPPGTLLTHVEGIEIRQEDLIRLKASRWLNDHIINAYMGMIHKRSEDQENVVLPKVYAFNTYFFTKLSQKDQSYQTMKNWIKKIDLFSYDIVLVPIHLGNHWCLVVIDLRKKTIRYYDSLGNANDGGLKKLLQFFTDAVANKQATKKDTKAWRCSYLKEPAQSNGSDCGVFICQFADYVSRDLPINFTEHDMPYFRKRMAIEILNGKLITIGKTIR
ncbi:C-terminal catalytic domain [Cardinium endosymbiont of Sogatella furcifera]|uniref:Ulp1 family isopeptidase n=1 Tax=Cardinium endosymbiont of Sogatella furcifera TaxID=650378 RepID=UPI000E0D1B59|nr:Ulp1 family isopeptidase [Cardinium endosymbiont of Sogatella furcifera]AXI23881.1 C-terminal catalytic domain [Cardinium endosymbiont of Sogatella furcifera]